MPRRQRPILQSGQSQRILYCPRRMRTMTALPLILRGGGYRKTCSICISTWAWYMRTDGITAYSLALIRTPFPATQCSEAATLPPRFCGRLRAAISDIPSACHYRSIPTGCSCLRAPSTAFPLQNCSAWQATIGSPTITFLYRVSTNRGRSFRKRRSPSHLYIFCRITRTSTTFP